MTQNWKQFLVLFALIGLLATFSVTAVFAQPAEEDTTEAAVAEEGDEAAAEEDGESPQGAGILMLLLGIGMVLIVGGVFYMREQGGNAIEEAKSNVGDVVSDLTN